MKKVSPVDDYVSESVTQPEPPSAVVAKVVLNTSDVSVLDYLIDKYEPNAGTISPLNEDKTGVSGYILSQDTHPVILGAIEVAMWVYSDMIDNIGLNELATMISEEVIEGMGYIVYHCYYNHDILTMKLYYIEQR